MSGKTKLKGSGAQKRKTVMIDLETTEGRNRRGRRVYVNKIEKESQPTSEKRTDGSKSPSKRSRPLSPEIHKDQTDQGDRSVPPYKRLRQKTKV
jgi:hypothetical protein